MEQQQPVYAPEKNPRTYTMLTNVLPTTCINNEISHEQQIVEWVEKDRKEKYRKEKWRK